MREIIFDTETTGLDMRDDRIIELGGVELVNRFPTGRTFHKFINPQGRAIHAEAQAVHGISAADLVGKPTFAEIAQEWLDFTDGAKLIAHNATFDIGFLNIEFSRLDRAAIDVGRVVDTLALARRSPYSTSRCFSKPAVAIVSTRSWLSRRRPTSSAPGCWHARE